MLCVPPCLSHGWPVTPRCQCIRQSTRWGGNQAEYFGRQAVHIIRTSYTLWLCLSGLLSFNKSALGASWKTTRVMTLLVPHSRQVLFSFIIIRPTLQSWRLRCLAADHVDLSPRTGRSPMGWCARCGWRRESGYTRGQVKPSRPLGTNLDSNLQCLTMYPVLMELPWRRDLCSSDPFLLSRPARRLRHHAVWHGKRR